MTLSEAILHIYVALLVCVVVFSVVVITTVQGRGEDGKDGNRGSARCEGRDVSYEPTK